MDRHRWWIVRGRRCRNRRDGAGIVEGGVAVDGIETDVVGRPPRSGDECPLPDLADRDAKGRFFFNDTATTEIYTLSLHDALPISILDREANHRVAGVRVRETE